MVIRVYTMVILVDVLYIVVDDHVREQVAYETALTPN